MVRRGPVPRDAAADLAKLRRTDKRDPAGRDWAAQCHGGQDRRKGNRHHGSPGHPNGKGAGEERNERPEQNPEKDVQFAGMLRINRDLGAHPKDQVSSRGKHKAREQERNGAYTHEPRDIEL